MVDLVRGFFGFHHVKNYNSTSHMSLSERTLLACYFVFVFVSQFFASCEDLLLVSFEWKLHLHLSPHYQVS